jgi:hypothetical protein
MQQIQQQTSTTATTHNSTRTTEGRGGRLCEDGRWDRPPYSVFSGVAVGKHPQISPTKQKRLLLNVIQTNSKNQIPIFIFSNKKELLLIVRR